MFCDRRHGTAREGDERARVIGDEKKDEIGWEERGWRRDDDDD